MSAIGRVETRPAQRPDRLVRTLGKRDDRSPSAEPGSYWGKLQGADETKRGAGPTQRHAWQRTLQRSWLGTRRLRSGLHGRLDRALGVPLACIFCLHAGKRLASNAQFFLLTLELCSTHTDGWFIAHMFTSCRCVADVVPPEEQEGEPCQARAGKSKLIR